MGKTAADFEKIINEGRERKKNEALAAQIFGKGKDGRRKSVPLKSTAAGSLASRVGVQKRTSSVARIPAGDINGEWTHDLHNARSTPNLRAAAAAPSQPKPNSLAARLHAPGTAPPTGPRRNNGNRAAQVAGAFSRATASPAAAAQMNIRSAAPAAGMSIRGLAGPYAVMAQNFAPGTTAADIESAMTPIGGVIESCRLVKTHPLVIAEVVFQSREAADRVIQTFDNQTADGRLLHVYLKPGGASTPAAPTGPRAQRTNELRHGSNVVVDGSMGFDDAMDTSDAGYSDGSGGGRGLYSDRLVSGGPRGGGSRRGRGFDRGRNGR